MCKVMIMGGIKKANREKAARFIKEMGKEMSTSNTDGLGYSAVDEQGNMFGQRWLRNSDAFGGSKQPNPIVASAFEKLSPALEKNLSVIGPGEHNQFGDNPDLLRATAITLHTRYATSAKGMKNTHPFVYPELDISLIHNGVINNDKDFELTVSTCDSEAILRAYSQEAVNINMEAVKAMAMSLRGYYACGVFARDHEGKRIMDVFKGNHANLYIQEVRELDTFVFATSDTDVERVCARLGFTKGDSSRVKEGQLIRIDPLTGEILNLQDFFVPGVNYSSDRGSHSRTHSGTSWSQWAGQTNTGTGTGGSSNSNIIDVSNAGRRERDAIAKKIKGCMSKGQFEMMKLAPSIQELSRQEVVEYARENGWFKRAE